MYYIAKVVTVENLKQKTNNYLMYIIIIIMFNEQLNYKAIIL